MKKGIALLLALLVLLSSAATADKKITVTFTGDATLGSEETKKNRPDSFVSVAAEQGYGYFFENFKELFGQDDLTIVNLEGVLWDSNAWEDETKTYRFRAPSEFAKILTEGNVEACALSNNHMLDFGVQGYEGTCETLDSYGIAHFDAKNYYIFEKDGIKIAFFAIVSPQVASTMKWAQKEEIVRHLKEDEGVNAVVVILHAGQEYAMKHRNDQEKYATQALDILEANLVITHHPHVLQGIDVMKDAYVFYSLGNFCFGGNSIIGPTKKTGKACSLPTMVVQADLIFKDDGTYKGQQLRIYPAHSATEAVERGDRNDYKPRFATAEEAQEVLDLIMNDTEGINLGLLDEDTGSFSLPYLAADPLRWTKQTEEQKK